ncbi:MAG: hypothetical protein HY553_07635 [Elusimicrobia bacterium]|nr:hypothetical protein [Elusimicrobiota bacterium]
MGESRAEVSQRELPGWLLARFPGLQDEYREKIREHYGTDSPPAVSPYVVLSFVVRAHVEDLLEKGDRDGLREVFEALEVLANRGDDSVRNELGVAMEELEVWKVWRFLGPTMRANAFTDASWYPETPENARVDRSRYERRWREELEKIGGFENLVVENELLIRHRLVTEFGIRGLRAPEPGGEEWRELRLRWPWPQTTTVYVQLLDEGTPCSRPTQAEPLGDGRYRLLPAPHYDPEDERWEFPPGSIVRTELRKDGSGALYRLAVKP